jgi:hypothetical protein
MFYVCNMVNKLWLLSIFMTGCCILFSIQSNFIFDFINIESGVCVLILMHTIQYVDFCG